MSEIIPGGYNDPDAEGNRAEYMTMNTCIETGCERFGGTAWGKYWCFYHNVERLDRVSSGLKGLLK